MPRALSDPATLLGDWQLSRVIDDRMTGLQSRIDGELSLAGCHAGPDSLGGAGPLAPAGR